HRMDVLMSSTADHLYLLDAEGRYLYASPAALRALGRTLGEVVGRTPREGGMPPEGADAVVERVRRVLETGETLVEEAACPTPEGQRTFEYAVSAVGHGEPVGTVAISGRDVTARREAEAKARESEQRYRRLFEGMRDWVLVYRL